MVRKARLENDLSVPRFLERALVAAQAHARVVGSQWQPDKPLDARSPRLIRGLVDERWGVLHPCKHRQPRLLRQRMGLQARDLRERRPVDGAVTLGQLLECIGRRSLAAAYVGVVRRDVRIRGGAALSHAQGAGPWLTRHL